MSATHFASGPDVGEGRLSNRSCSTCAKAKAKCVRSNGDLDCDRCTRLNKECHAKEVTQRKRKPIKLTRSAQLEKLESKLESLVNALSTQQTQTQSTDEYQDSTPTSHDASERATEKAYGKDLVTGSIPLAAKSSHSGLEILNKMCAAPDPSDIMNAPTSGVDDSVRQLGDKTVQKEGRMLLDRYLRLMADGSPFVKIPPDTTFEQLSKEKPLLMQAIATVAYFHDLPQQQEMAKPLTHRLIDRIIFKGEKSIEILQALLTFITWIHPHSFWSQQLTSLLHLAIAQSVDLAIDRRPDAFDKQKFESAAQRAVNGPQKPPVTCTLEERRAVLGIFHLTSTLSTTFKRLDAVKFTPWHEECLKALDQASEYESDKILITSVRLQKLVEEVYPAGDSSIPAHMYAKVYQKELQRLHASNLESDTNVHLRLAFVAAEIHLWETTYAELFEQCKGQRTLQRQHLEGIYNCAEAVKKNLRLFITIPTETYVTLPFPIFVAFAQAFMSMLRLSTLEVEGWDSKAFREQSNIAELTRSAARAYEEASKSKIDGLSIDNDSFARWAGKLRWLEQMFETKYSQNETMTGPNQSCLGTTSVDNELGLQQPTPPDDLLTNDIIMHLDDAFWNTFTSDFDFGYNDFGVT